MPKTTVKVDKDLVKEAHELGLNVSKICENALKMAIEQLKPLYKKNSPENFGRCGGWDSNPIMAGDIPRNFPFFIVSFYAYFC